MEGFYRQRESEARKLLAKEKKESFEARSSSFLGGSYGKNLMQIISLVTRLSI